VVLADDSYLLRQAVAHVLRDAEGIEVVATCADRDTLLSSVEQERPDVALRTREGGVSIFSSVGAAPSRPAEHAR
jgi:DNA-binding NarL/FixJ family response regulator